MHRTWTQGTGEEPWPLSVPPWALHSHLNTPGPATLLNSPGRFWQVPHVDSCLANASNRGPPSPGPASPDYSLGSLFSRAFIVSCSGATVFSHPCPPISPCPDCTISHWMMLTAPSLPLIFPPHNGCDNFAKTRS